MRFPWFIAIALMPISCIDTVPLDSAACPCLTGYYCTDEDVCRPNDEVVSSLKGRSYIVSTTIDQWVAPAGFAEALATEDDFQDIYPVFAFEILDVDPRKMTFSALFGIVHDGLQDMGLVTYEMAGSLEIESRERISFNLGPEDVLTILFAQGPDEAQRDSTLARYYGLTLDGVFAEGGARVEEGTLTMVMNAEEYYTLFYIAEFEDSEDLCKNIAAHLGIQCEACPKSPHEPLCLTFAAEHLAYPAAADFSLETVYTFDAKYD